MALQSLSFETIHEIDNGRVAKGFNDSLRRVRLDCEDRPGLREPRRINITVEVTPLPDGEGGDLAECDVRFFVTDAIPKRKTKPYQMIANRGELSFNVLSPDAPKQRTLDQAEREAERKDESREQAQLEQSETDEREAHVAALTPVKSKRKKTGS